MTKAERIQLIRTYFNEIDRIEGNVPCVQWRHAKQSDLYLYSREDESLAVHEIVVVKSPTPKVDKALKYAVKHYFQSAEELSVILESFSDKPRTTKPVQRQQHTTDRPAVNPKLQSVHKLANVENQVRSKIPQPVNSTLNSQSSIPTQPHIPNRFTQPMGFSDQPKVKRVELGQKGVKVGLLLALLLVIAAFITNPNEKQHRKVVREKMMENVLQASTANYTASEESGSETTSDRPMGIDQIQAAIPAMVHRTNFFLFSLTELRFSEREKIIGIGFFGMVKLDEPELNSYQSYLQGDISFTENIDTDPVDEATIQEMKRAVIVAVMDRFFSDPEKQDELTFKFVFHNRSNRSISTIEGNLVFSDTSGDIVKILPVMYDRPLGIGERAIFHSVQSHDAANPGDNAVASTNLADFSIDWEPTELQFKDGTSLSL